MNEVRSKLGPAISRRQTVAPRFDLPTLEALAHYREALKKQTIADRAFRRAQASMLDHVHRERAGITAKAALAVTLAARAALDACLSDE